MRPQCHDALANRVKRRQTIDSQAGATTGQPHPAHIALVLER